MPGSQRERRTLRLACAGVALLAGLLVGACMVACDQIAGIVEGELPPDGSTRDGRARDATPDHRDATRPDVDASSPGDAEGGCAPLPDVVDCDGQDPTISPNNCGTCGHVCRGTCAGGLCQPTALVVADAGNVIVNVIASAGGQLYWAEQGPGDSLAIRADDREWKAPPRTLTVTTSVDFGGGAVDDSGVYFFRRVPDGGGWELDSVGLDGGAAPTVVNTTLGTESVTSSFALDETSVYVANQTNSVYVVPKSGADAATPPPTYPSTWTDHPRSVVLETLGPTKRVSWLVAPWTVGAEGGALVSFGVSTTSSHYTIPLDEPNALVVADGWLYFFDNVTASLGRLREDTPEAGVEFRKRWSWMPEGGRAPSNFIDGVIDVSAAEAFVSVYDVAHSDEIVELSLCGSAPRLRASSTELTPPIVADDTYLYWGSIYNTIYRMAK
jgi:hypothetical protein